MKRALAAALIGSLLVAAVAQESSAPSATIADALTADERFSTFVAALETAGWLERLAARGPITVFAPTNEAFAELSPEERESLFAAPERLDRFVQRHLIPDDIILLPGGRILENGALNPIERLLR